MALAARGGRVGAGHARGIRRGRRAERAHRFVELDDGLPDFGDGALRRDADGARRARMQRQRRGARERRECAYLPETTSAIGMMDSLRFVIVFALLHRSMPSEGSFLFDCTRF